MISLCVITCRNNKGARECPHDPNTFYDEYITYLNKKLKEEVHEYLENNCMEELRDIFEVVEAVSQR